MGLPKFLVLCIDDRDTQTLHSTLSKHWPAHTQSLNLTTIHENLRNLSNDTKFDLIVSPANSYGILDGGFDDAISRTFCLPQHDYRALTNVAQQKLYEQWHGFAPPGTCTLVSMPRELRETNRWGCKLVALCPTMRTPDDARWDREVVYECVWSLMCEVDRWNSRNTSSSSNLANGESRIDTILITPLATGTGGVSREKWALQFVLALKHFVDAQKRPERWSRLRWEDLKEAKEVERSWQM
ncbi:hypothetical protein DPV78_007763 [Talaromyces pinophilus]|nr:hypothetical protein DPV78_007763 [Talaromyces pinophilus]